MIYFLIIPISIQLLGPDLVFPVYEIDREHSEHLKIPKRFSGAAVLEKCLKRLYISYDKGSLHCALLYHSVMKLSQVFFSLKLRNFGGST